jgi:cytidyltransferase-like protein
MSGVASQVYEGTNRNQSPSLRCRFRRGHDRQCLLPADADRARDVGRILSSRSRSTRRRSGPLFWVTRAASIYHGEAVRRREEWRKHGLRVGFTNGCYDLLHPGHVSLLKSAAAECDRLIVAINSDASVRRIKGPSRPLQDERSRAYVVGALSAVDLVVVFDEEFPCGEHRSGYLFSGLIDGSARPAVRSSRTI